MSSKKSSAESGQESDEQIHRDSTGAAERRVGTVETTATIETLSAHTGSAPVQVTGHALDDEPGVVSVRATVGDRTVALSLSDTEARALAAQLEEAARFTSRGAER